MTSKQEIFVAHFGIVTSRSKNVQKKFFCFSARVTSPVNISFLTAYDTVKMELGTYSWTQRVYFQTSPQIFQVVHYVIDSYWKLFFQPWSGFKSFHCAQTAKKFHDNSCPAPLKLILKNGDFYERLKKGTRITNFA